MPGELTRFKVAAVQASPAFLNRDLTVEKACDLIAQAGREGAALAVFPEAFIPGYPVWVWFVPPIETGVLREVYAVLHRNALTVPGPAVDRLSEAARTAGVSVAIGIQERNSESSDSTIFSSLLYIDSDGRLAGRHRKLIPTTAERLVWGRGDGSDLDVYEFAVGRVGGLICWENYMPLARYALYEQGLEVCAAPTWDYSETWISTVRHIAREGHSPVISACTVLRKSDIPDVFAFKDRYLSDAPEWLNSGNSVIVDPDGGILAGPVAEEETVLYGEVGAADIIGPRWQLDVAGHYSRPDIFDLRINGRRRPLVPRTAPPEIWPAEIS